MHLHKKTKHNFIVVFALRPQNMIDAMVQDTNAHLTILESERAKLESALAEGKSGEDLALVTQTVAQAVKDYRTAATHVKRASTKPKPKPKKEAAKPPDQNGQA